MTMLDISRIRAITLDLDDTLWPIWPIIARAEEVLLTWLRDNAPATALLSTDREALRLVREHIVQTRPDLSHDLSALRRESIRLLLLRAGDDPALAETAFDVFFAERHRVELFDDVLPALDLLAARFPLVALSNGNADIQRVGLGRYFRAALSAREFGAAKPETRFFHAAAQAAGVTAADVLHVGDDAHLDVVGGLDAGMQVAWVNREAQDWPAQHPAHTPHATVADLGALVRLLNLQA